jgi:hypothetical protein
MRLDAHNIAKFNPRSHPTFLFSHFELLGGVKLFNKKMPKKVATADVAQFGSNGGLTKNLRVMTSPGTA